MRYKHYAPKASVVLVEGSEKAVLSCLRNLCLDEQSKGRQSCVLCFSEHKEALKECSPHDIGPKADASETAKRLFSVLRMLDEEGMETVFSEVLPPEGVGLAVMNRLGRAAAFRIIRAD